MADTSYKTTNLSTFFYFLKLTILNLSILQSTKSDRNLVYPDPLYYEDSSNEFSKGKEQFVQWWWINCHLDLIQILEVNLVRNTLIMEARCLAPIYQSWFEMKLPFFFQMHPSCLDQRRTTQSNIIHKILICNVYKNSIKKYNNYYFSYNLFMNKLEMVFLKILLFMAKGMLRLR